MKIVKKRKRNKSEKNFKKWIYPKIEKLRYIENNEIYDNKITLFKYLILKIYYNNNTIY